MSLPTYLSLPLLNFEPNWVDPSLGMTLAQAKTAMGTDLSPGALAYDAPYQSRPRTSVKLSFVLSSRAEMLAARDFLRSVALGRWKAFWVPLWTRSFLLAADIADDATTFTVVSSGYVADDYAGAGLGREHLAFFPRVPGTDLTIVGRKVSGVVDNEDGTETITISSAVGDAMKAGDVVSYLLLCRLDTDVPALVWETAETGTLELPLLDLPRETP